MAENRMTNPDPPAAPEERAARLLACMTMEEKVGQLIQPFGWQVYSFRNGILELTEEFKEAVRTGAPGSLYGMLRADPWTGVTLADGLSPREGAEAVNAIQRYVLEHSRLAIPLLLGEECSHGHMAIGATVFPVPLAVGSTWNPALYRDMCRAVARETRLQGGSVTYSPVLDLARDPRWGRTEECFGEDPCLVGEFAVAAVEGMQGTALDGETSVAVTLKHFAGYGSSEGGRNAGPVSMGRRELLEKDLAPFAKAVKAGAASVMPAYHEIDGVPCTSNRELLDDLLRGQWNFDGMVVSDCGAVEMLAAGHQTAADDRAAVLQALAAGVDMEMSGELFRKHLLALGREDGLAAALIDRAAHRVLTLKYRLGLFEHPYADPDLAECWVGCEEHAVLARQVAAEGVVLLRNDDLLPLKRESATVAVIGPNADAPYNQLGDYTAPQPPGRVATVLNGIRAKLAECGGRVLYAPGCRIRGEERDGFGPALEAAAQADYTVLVLGGSSARDFGEGSIDLKTGASLVTERTKSEMDCGEGIDRLSLGLSGVQRELAEAVIALRKPVVLVYINGRPIAEPELEAQASAVLEAWYPGQEGGHAIADLLYGDANPSGRLTVSIPREVGQLPVFYNGKRSRGKRYLEGDSLPSYPFGFGLSYTEFRYANLLLSRANLLPGETATASIELTNIGTRAGAEVVQLYVTDVASTVSRPALELKGFCKQVLQPGETATVRFVIGPEQLSCIGPDYRPVVEPGRFLIRIGRHSADTLKAELTVVASSFGDQATTIR